MCSRSSSRGWVCLCGALGVVCCIAVTAIGGSMNLSKTWFWELPRQPEGPPDAEYLSSRSVNVKCLPCGAEEPLGTDTPKGTWPPDQPQGTLEDEGDPPALTVEGGCTGRATSQLGVLAQPFSSQGGGIYKIWGVTTIRIWTWSRKYWLFGQFHRVVAESDAHLSHFRIKDGVVQGEQIRQESKRIGANVAVHKLKKDWATFGVWDMGAMISDPIVVQLVEIETADTATQELFSFGISDTGFSAISWNDTTGVVLEVPSDTISSLHISGGFNSSWITSSTIGTFSLSFADGEFTAGGDFAGLPWDITTDSSGAAVRAELPPEHLPAFEAEYVIPDSLIDDILHYQESMTHDMGAAVKDSCVGDLPYEPPYWDTISTSSANLAVGINGNVGQYYRERVGLEFYDAGDCDTTATTYLWDGSPIVGYIRDADTIVNYSIYGEIPVYHNGFIPVDPLTPVADSGDYYVFKSGRFLTHDSLLAMHKTTYAPKQQQGDPGDLHAYMIERIDCWLHEADTVVTDVRLGEVVDWDIPADTGARNNSGYVADCNLIYQQGCEEDGEGCQPNDNRFGGIVFLDGYSNGIHYRDEPFGAYTADNLTYVFPYNGLDPATTYPMLGNDGYSLHEESCADIHTVMVFDTGLTIAPDDTLTYYVMLVTMQNGSLYDYRDVVDSGKQWYCDHLRSEPCNCCEGIRGNWDGDWQEAINIVDLTYAVAYLFGGGSAPPCLVEGDVNANGTIEAPIVNIVDLTYLVNYLFGGGSPPYNCDGTPPERTRGL